MKRSILSLILSLGVVMLAGCSTFRSSSSARVQSLDNSLAALKTEFNRDTSKPRLLALFSPTCGGCLYGARALQRQAKAIQPAPGGPRILIVWLPMLETDNEQEARNSARKFHFRGAHHFYDADKRTSARLMAEQFPHAIRDALEVLPPGHPKRKALEAQKDLPPEKVPLWDALLVFPPGVRWDEQSPAPIWWTRQIGFNGDGKPGEPTGLFWKNDPRQLLVRSDWNLEAREALRFAQQSNSDRK